MGYYRHMRDLTGITQEVFLSFFHILVKKHISILQDVSGIIRPCRTTLLARSSKLRKDNIVVGFGWEVGCCFEGYLLPERKGSSEPVCFRNLQIRSSGRKQRVCFLATFIEAENSVIVASLKNMLSVVRSVYVVVTLDEDVAFLRYGYLKNVIVL
ncbi:hypothetical protein ACS0TY_034356 [Phlomoides rotata]